MKPLTAAFYFVIYPLDIGTEIASGRSVQLYSAVLLLMGLVLIDNVLGHFLMRLKACCGK